MHRYTIPFNSRRLPIAVALLGLLGALIAMAFGLDLAPLLDAAPGLLLANAPLALPDAIKEITAGVEAMKKTQAEGLAELRRDVERLEAKGNLTGLMGQQRQGADTSADEVLLVLDDADNAKATPVLRGAKAIQAYYDKKAAPPAAGGAPGGKPAEQRLTLTEFLRAVADVRTSPEAKAVLNTGTLADGGYMVPNWLMGRVLAAMVPESAVLQAGAGILPLDSGAKTFTIAATSTVPSAAWRAENAPVAESSPGFRAVELVPRSLAFYFKVSREWLADAVGTDDALRLAIAQAFATKLDATALLGSGTAPEPRGIRNTAGIISVANGAAGASLATTRYTKPFEAVQLMLEANGPMPTAAIMSPRSRVILGGLLDTTGQPIAVPPMLASVRQLSTSQVPNNLTVGASTDCSEIYMGDFTRMVYAQREALSIQLLDQTFATDGQVGFVCHARADIGVLYPKAFALISGVRP